MAGHRASPARDLPFTTCMVATRKVVDGRAKPGHDGKIRTKLGRDGVGRHGPSRGRRHRAMSATTAESRVAVATQRQLIWWRFRRHKLALVSAVIVALFYLVALFADTIAYTEPFDTQATRSYIPPQPI